MQSSVERTSLMQSEPRVHEVKEDRQAGRAGRRRSDRRRCVGVRGASLASADPTPSPSGSTTTATDGHGSNGSADTAVTGDELAKVTAAMKAKDSAVTVTSVRKDPDGSYDVLGTKAGANVFYDVTADLKTFTLNTHTATK
jgi:hypothetical protein